jgi:hypothetical protein
VSSLSDAPAGVGPRTIVLPGNGTQAATYVLPPGLLQYVQSVLVQVDATAAPAVRPTLSISEQSGVVIATKRQGEAIPAGDTGSATWALRLSDDGGGIRFDTQPQAGGFLYTETVGPGVTANGYGTEIIDNGGGAGGGIRIANETQNNTELLIEQLDDGGLRIEESGFGGIKIKTTAAMALNGMSASFVQVGGGVRIQSGVLGADVRIFLTSATSILTVYDKNSAPIFQIDNNGDLHGLTGKALVFDL